MDHNFLYLRLIMIEHRHERLRPDDVVQLRLLHLRDGLPHPLGGRGREAGQGGLGQGQQQQQQEQFHHEYFMRSKKSAFVNGKAPILFTAIIFTGKHTEQFILGRNKKEHVNQKLLCLRLGLICVRNHKGFFQTQFILRLMQYSSLNAAAGRNDHFFPLSFFHGGKSSENQFHLFTSDDA